MMLQVSKLVVLHCVEGWYVGMTPQSRFSRNYFTEAEATDALKATREHLLIFSY